MSRPSDPLQTEAQFLKGVGPRRAEQLHRLGIKTAEDMLHYLPRRYDDRRNLPPLIKARPGQQITARGYVVDVQTIRTRRRGQVILKAALQDETATIHLTWFNQPWVGRQLAEVSGEIVAFGTVKEVKGKLEMASPEWEPIEDDEDSEDFARLTPVYPLKDKVFQQTVRQAAQSAVEHFSSLLPDPLPPEIRKAHGLMTRGRAMAQMHFPESEAELERARTRIAFEEFFYLQLALLMKRREAQQETGIAFDLDAPPVAGSRLFAEDEQSLEEQARKMLPFEMTGAQQRVVDEIWTDMRKPAPMNRLVQGDVGSGKTAVAACAMLGAVRCGYQAAMMAPTEILAEQHYINLRKLLEPAGIHVRLLVGKQGARERKKHAADISTGIANVVVGTHALIQDAVVFRRLGLAVIDEQHRFGVLQRAALRQKSETHPDVLVMTATPIPRTLTMTLYGDLDVSVIDELPPGRKAIKTHWRRPDQRPKVYQQVDTLLDQGRQAYFVCPLIKESDKMQVQAADDLHYRLSTSEFKHRTVGLLHGQMKAAVKEEVMDRFRAGEIDLLVSTTVIEVGVDVPNATVMVIEDANRFGLAQLHQLRGRVGRGEHQSFCILIANAEGDGERRMKVMVETSDGFRIAEEDLDLRGAGDLAGTQQTGHLDFLVADLVRDQKLLGLARNAASKLLDDDPELTSPTHAALLKQVQSQRDIQALVAVS